MATTFEQFIATKQENVDLGEILRDTELYRGNLYVGSMWIQDTTSWPDDIVASGRWYLAGRSECFSNDLRLLERKLYDYAVKEGTL